MQISTDLIIQFNVFTVWSQQFYTKNSHELIKSNN